MQLLLPKTVCNDMIAHAKAESPRECCGFVCGELTDGIGRAMCIRSLVNTVETPGDFLVHPRSIFLAQRFMFVEKLETLAVYHSHPMSAPVPSRGDMIGNPTGVSVIVSLRKNEPEIRAWVGASEIDLMIEE